MLNAQLKATGGSGGIGDVVGPASAADNEICRFDGTTGKLIQDGTTATLSDAGAMFTPSLTLTTDLAIADGGTGSSTATAAFDNLSPTTTKGDLIVSDGSNNIREAIGTDGFVLTSDSSQSSGMKWAASQGGVITWTRVLGTSQAMSVANGYFSVSVTLATFTLPVTAAVGDIVHVMGTGAGLFKIAQNASQVISFPTAGTTTAGTGGFVTSLDIYCSLELICNATDNGWLVKSSTGSFTIT